MICTLHFWQQTICFCTNESIDIFRSQKALEQEVEFLAGLDHPNIVKVFGFTKDAGYIRIAMKQATHGKCVQVHLLVCMCVHACMCAHVYVFV